MAHSFQLTGAPPSRKAIVYDQLDAGQSRHDDVSFAVLFEEVDP